VRIGLISDTHGLLRPEVFDAFEGVDRILHAGDIGPADLLVELEALAPLTAVSGNTDRYDVASTLPETAELDLLGRRLVLVHGHRLGSPTPAALRTTHPQADIVVFGHTHRALIDRSASPLVVNPGSAGATRFGLPASVAMLTLDRTGSPPEIAIVPLTQ